MKRKKEKLKDRRIGISTVRMLAVAVTLAVFTATFAHSIAWGENENRKSQQTGTHVFEELDTVTLDGEKFTHEDFKGSKLTLVNAWKTNCPACMKEMPDLQAISTQYDPKDIRIVGICSDALNSDNSLNTELRDKGIKLMADAGVTFTNLIPSADLVEFLRATVAGFPTTFVVDSEGKVIDVSVGSDDEEGWKAFIDKQLSNIN